MVPFQFIAFHITLESFEINILVHLFKLISHNFFSILIDAEGKLYIDHFTVKTASWVTRTNNLGFT